MNNQPEPAAALDLPSYLETIPRWLAHADEPCPECGGILAGWYESDTNTMNEIMCTECTYTEEERLI